MFTNVREDVEQLSGDGEHQNLTGELQACFVYTPAKSSNGPRQRPKKKKKVSHSSEVLSARDGNCFMPLLNGSEKSEYIDRRLEAFEATWAEQKRLIEAVLEEINASTVDNVMHFLASVNGVEHRSQIPTCIIRTGPAVTTSGSVLGLVAGKTGAGRTEIMINLTPSHCPNLKTALKHIIRQGTSQNSTGDEDEDVPTARQSTRYLNYDLEILYKYMHHHSVKMVVLAFQNTEAFDGNVFAELVDVLRSWSDRIPSVFLLEIASSVENLQEKMSQATMRHLDGVAFESVNAGHSLERIFKAATSPDIYRSMWIGPGLNKLMLDRQLEHIQSASSFTQASKYAYMTHFFANPLSILLDSSQRLNTLQREHYEAMRDLASFRGFVQDLIEKNELDKAQSLLDDDDFLHKNAFEMLQEGQTCLHDLLGALDVISNIQFSISDKPGMKWSDLYIKGMSASLADSTHIRDLLLSVRKMPSDRMEAMLDKISHNPNLDLSVTIFDLQTMTASINGADPLRSEFDIRHETLRTTIVAQKVELSKHKAALSKQDAAYSQIVNRVNTTLEAFFTEYLINPKDLIFHEIFLFDLKSPCRDVFAPAPRYAVERALSAPHDYLDCDCCGPGAGALSSSQPATAVLYQLYLESGALINIGDLWLAFYAIVGPEQGEEDETSEEQASVLFYRALAELRYLGFIKNSRRKPDHLTKLAWKGL